MKTSKVDKLVAELNLKELQESIKRLSEKEDETETEETEVQETESTSVETKKETPLPDNYVTKETYNELNSKYDKINEMVLELMKDKPVGVQRKVVSKVTNADIEEYNVENVFNNLKRRK